MKTIIILSPEVIVTAAIVVSMILCIGAVIGALLITSTFKRVNLGDDITLKSIDKAVEDKLDMHL